MKILSILIISILIILNPIFAKKDKTKKFSEKYKGELITKGQFNDSGKQGNWELYPFQGQGKGFKGEFVDDKQNGKWECKNDNTISAIIYYNLGKVDSAYSYFEDGTLKYKLEFSTDSTGTASIYYSNGQLQQYMPLKNRRIHGNAKIYFSNGQLHRTTNFNQAKRNSVVNCFDENGEDIDGGNLENGNGLLIIYYFQNEVASKEILVQSKEEYKSWKQNGEATYNHENGKIEEIGLYAEGYRTGKWIRYDDDGNLKKEKEYKVEDERSRTNYKGKHFPYYLDYNSVLFEQAEFLEGEQKMYQFIGKNLVYPKKAKIKGVSGRVFLSYDVDKYGEIGSIKVLRGIGYGCDKECIRIIEKMPRWTPGTLYGFPVGVGYRMPIKFTLQ